jgi:lipoprotein-anchoring transpeptidase ErfK/SrfK
MTRKTLKNILAFTLVLLLLAPPSVGIAADDDTVGGAATSQGAPGAAVPEGPDGEEVPATEDGLQTTPGDGQSVAAPDGEGTASGEDGPAGPDPGNPGLARPEGVPGTDSADEGAGGIEGTEGTEGIEGESLATLGAAPPAPPLHETPLPPGHYRIRPAVSDIRMLDIDKGSKAPGANLHIYESNDATNQFFDVSYDKSGFYQITSVRSGLALDVSGASARSGANVIQYTWRGGANQKWVLTKSSDRFGNDVYMIASALGKNLVLDVNRGADANRANVQVWTKHGKASQQFYFMPLDPKVASERTVKDGIYTLRSALRGSYMADIAGAGTANGLQLQLWSAHGGLAQLFDIRWQASEGFYLIRPLGSAKALDVTGNQVLATTPVVQWSVHKAVNQQWAIRDNKDGTVSFVAKNSGLVLDVEGARAAPEAKLILYYQHGGDNQRFVLKPAKADPLAEGIFSVVPSTSSSKVIDIESSSASSGARALAYKSHGGMNQKFQVTRTGAATYAFSVLSSGMYLTAGSGTVYQAPGSGGKPTTAQQWVASWSYGGVRFVNAATNEAMVLGSGGNDIRTAAPNSTMSQTFRMQSVAVLGPGYYTIRSATGLALDLNGGSINRGANVQLYKPNSSAAQIWKLEPSSDGYYTIANARSQKLVDISGGKTAEGTNVLVWDKNGAAWQKWRPVPSGDGWFFLQSATGTYLSAAGEGNYSGANVFVSTKATKKAQKFRFVATTYTGYVGTYADVNLTTQKMIYVKNGQLILESDIVSGAPYMKTPTGTFSVMWKASPTVLRGPGYASPVTYWMQFTRNGVGFHDATWQSRFGGTWYVNHGSHGCINMPLSAARTLYANISVGDTVKVHY